MTMYFDYLKDELANTANKIIDALMGSNVEARNWAYERFKILIDDDLARTIDTQEQEIINLKQELKDLEEYYADIIQEKNDEIKDMKYELESKDTEILSLSRQLDRCLAGDN